MGITYSTPSSLESDWAQRAKTTRAQLAKLQKRRVELEAQQLSDPYCSSGEGWKRELSPTRQMIGVLESRLRQEEANAGIGRDAGPAALAAGSYWHGSDY